MRYALIFLLAMAAHAWGQDDSSLTVLSCVGEQTHELVLSWLDDEPLLTYYADGTAVATAKTNDGYANEQMLQLPFLGTWYVFDETKQQVWTGGNADSCVFAVAPSQVIDPEALGFGPIALNIGYN